MTNPSTNFQLFQTGETDYDAFTSRPDDIEQLKMLGFANINLYGSSDYSQVEFNVHRPALQDKRVRQALIYGLDRQKLIDVVYQGYGKVAIEPIAPISWAFNAEGVNLTLTIRHRPKSCWMRPAGNQAPTVSAPKTASAWS
ncbi:oligopeptide ABC transporter [Klebsiella pneumoniae]|nr:oligopeptide ABC transporter [Klebsiella pneumoniae]